MSQGALAPAENEVVLALSHLTSGALLHNAYLGVTGAEWRRKCRGMSALMWHVRRHHSALFMDPLSPSAAGGAHGLHGDFARRN